MHNSECECQVCRDGIDASNKWEADCMKEFGWFIHLVPSSTNSDYVNYHTHGFDKTWNHLDFQIVLNISHNETQHVFNNLSDRVKGGEIFFEDAQYERIIKAGYKIKVMKTRECGREVMRVIFPDNAGLFPGDEGCDSDLAGQDTAIVD